MSMIEFDYRLSVFGRVWLFQIWILLRPRWPYLYLPGLAIGGFESLTALRGFMYRMDVSFRIFLSRFEINMSCRLIFNSDETFNMLVRS